MLYCLSNVLLLNHILRDVQLAEECWEINCFLKTVSEQYSMFVYPEFICLKIIFLIPELQHSHFRHKTHKWYAHQHTLWKWKMHFSQWFEKVACSTSYMLTLKPCSMKCKSTLLETTITDMNEHVSACHTHVGTDSQLHFYATLGLLMRKKQCDGYSLCL